MSDFHYIDLFATKGIEYLIVLAFFGLLILAWRVVAHRAEPVVAAVQRGASSVRGWFRMARQAFFHPGHTWVREENSGANGELLVGMDDFAQQLLGRADAVLLPAEGTSLRQGEPAWRVSVDGREVSLLAPVSGEVVALNPQVSSDAGVLNEAPYDQGWLMRVRPSAWQAERNNLLSGGAARAWMQETANEVVRRVSGPLGVAIQDGGVPVSGFVKHISPEHWDDVAADFFLTR